MILYLTEQGLKVNKEGQRFKITYPGSGRTKSLEVRINEIEEIFIFGKISLSPAIIHTCLKQNIPIHFLSFSGNYLGKLEGLSGRNVELRLNQYKSYFDEKRKLQFSKDFIKGKLFNQIKFLEKLKKRYPIEILEGYIFRLKLFLKELEKFNDIEEVRGLEGVSSKYYFEALQYIFKKLGWHFPGRTKRPPTDPVNALLSLGHTLLFSKIYVFVESASLDPYTGYLHTPDYGKPALVLDLMEEWRPIIVDSLVIRVLAWKAIKFEDFTDSIQFEEDEYSVKLTPVGLKKFLKHFQQKIKEEAIHPRLDKKYKYVDLFKEQIYQFARVLRGEEEKYEPFYLKE